MRVLSLCSSSKANCTYIEHKGEAVLVDIGCSYKALCEGLAMADRDVSRIKAVFITHEHTDHIKGLLTLSKMLDIPVYGSEGTLTAIESKGKVSPKAELKLISELENAPVNFEVNAFHTPHDSAESNGYTFTYDDTKIGICTDLGHITQEVREALTGSKFVLLESNYDLGMMTRNLVYPEVIKQRIRSDVGHLSNGDSASFARELIKAGATSLMLGHLSPENNTPEIAFGNMVSALRASGIELDRDYFLTIAKIQGDGKAVAI